MHIANDSQSALDELPGDLDDLESRLVAFLVLADGEPQNWATLLQQCGEGSRKATSAAISEAVRKNLIRVVYFDDEMAWVAQSVE